MVIALISGLISREMVQSRARQLTHTTSWRRWLQRAARGRPDQERLHDAGLARVEDPLTKIKAWVSLMQDAGDRLPASARDEGIRELRSESEHLARLTDNLLAIAQLESGEID